MKKWILPLLVVSFAFANLTGSAIKKVVKPFDESITISRKILKKIGANPEEQKYIKSATWSKKDGVYIFKRNHIFRPTKKNIENMCSGKAPIGIDGKSVNLHHIGQKNDGDLLELTYQEHRGEGNFKKLHSCLGKSCNSEVEHGNKWQKQTKEHWKSRCGDFRKAS